ncbi:gluconokinase [Citreimonas sp.]|uniref:gluconokinase n=1 Tax=Citreimonas sp. TaxID=3036715 RepID=UPI0035C852F6
MRHVLVMGICGTGKSSVASRLADRTGRVFVEADQYHSADAIARMARGEALTDRDRWDWLDRVADAALATGAPTVVACSALKEVYRQRLTDRLGAMDVVHLSGERAIVTERMSARSGHYMPVSLIDSQLADLQPPAGADTLTLDIDQPLEAIVAEAEAFVNRARFRA